MSPSPSPGPRPGAADSGRAVGAPFCVGLFAPAWPPGVAANGIITYVGAMEAELRAIGNPLAILAGSAVPGSADSDVHEMIEAARRRLLPSRLLQFVLYRTLPRVAAIRDWKLLARMAQELVASRGLRVLEMEESFGGAHHVQRALSIPVVVRLHGPWFLNGAALGVAEDAAFRRRVAAEGRAIATAAGVTAPSRDVLDRVRRRYGMALEHAAVIPNPGPVVAPRDRWRLEGCDRRRLLFVGRFDRHKGGDLVLEAFGRVWRELPDARLTFVGPDRGVLDDAGRRWSLPEYAQARLPDAMAAGAVELLGQKPSAELGPLRRGALATVICSRYENFPATVVEALAHGCPTIAADAGGIPEIVEDGETGLLHRAGDAEHLAARMLELLRSPARAASLGEAAGRAAERFHPRAIVPRILAYYAGLLR